MTDVDNAGRVRIADLDARHIGAPVTYTSPDGSITVHGRLLRVAFERDRITLLLDGSGSRFHPADYLVVAADEIVTIPDPRRSWLGTPYTG